MLQRLFIVALSCSLSALPVACSHFLKSNSPEYEQGEIAHVRAHTHSEASLEAIAHDLDHIEKHIDLYGSITTKHPDIWGAARMTKYQQEVEKVFARESDADHVTKQVMSYQGARTRSDQAFLASAVAMNMAITGRQAALLAPDPVTVETGSRTTTATVSSERTATSKESQSKKADGSDTTTSTDAKASDKSSDESKKESKTAAPSAVPIPTEAKIPTDFSTYTDSKVNVNRNNATLASLPGFEQGALRLEPTVVLDEKKRFLDHLNQIRRVNEGDDTADSPGYALYLMRVPVSVLPGKNTDVGHGAEIMMSIKPVLGDDLLPSTFRSLVINDMVDQFSELLVTLLNNDRSAVYNEYRYELLLRESSFVDKLRMPKLFVDAAQPQDKRVAFKSASNATMRVKPRSVSARPSRHAEYAFPMDHLDELFGAEYVNALMLGACKRYENELRNGRVVHLHEVRAHVREQVVAAYRLLGSAHPHIWQLCSPQLAHAIRDLGAVSGMNPSPTVDIYRNDFDTRLGKRPKETALGDRLLMEALAWGVVIEATLLNDLLVRDIRETTSNKGCPPLGDAWLDYYHPTPSPQAKHTFNSYVTCRWPMYTFAVDPVTEQQNIQDTLSQRREMQLAMSLAFASGRITASQFTRFARRLEADYQTVDLNRTVVGFSHGDNTFGWRFYPRFQTPDIPGTLEVVGRDLLGGRPFNRDQELRERRLEPGQRECMALVIMPSFVPFAEVHISSSWFSLADPKHKNASTHDNVKMSRMIRSIEKCMPDHKHIDNYLPGEYNRLQAKASMLASRFPLQDMKFQVPYENTLGGFEFFNSGITDLVPQLRGWYGIAGYDGKGVDVFLMGDNFSINNSIVVAGGKKIAPNLLSRQVLQVYLPEGVAVSADPDRQHSQSGAYVDIRLATPYGVGGPLRIPVLPQPPKEQPKAPAAPLFSALPPGQMIHLQRDTDLILPGDNFTADMRVLAEGKACNIELLSRKTVRVIVPKDLTPRTIDKRRFIHLTVGNAAGISAPLAVPVAPAPDEMAAKPLQAPVEFETAPPPRISSPPPPINSPPVDRTELSGPAWMKSK